VLKIVFEIIKDKLDFYATQLSNDKLVLTTHEITPDGLKKFYKDKYSEYLELRKQIKNKTYDKMFCIDLTNQLKNDNIRIENLFSMKFQYINKYDSTLWETGFEDFINSCEYMIKPFEGFKVILFD